MKKLLIILVLLIASCTETTENEDCNCIAIKSDLFTKNTSNKPSGEITICHYDSATDSFIILIIDESELNEHTNHQLDDLNGACVTAGLDDIEGIPYSNDCNDHNKRVIIQEREMIVLCEDK